MLSYRDMTFCAIQDCQNTECGRHRCHVPEETELPVSWAIFNDCPEYIGFEESTIDNEII